MLYSPAHCWHLPLLMGLAINLPALVPPSSLIIQQCVHFVCWQPIYTAWCNGSVLHTPITRDLYTCIQPHRYDWCWSRSQWSNHLLYLSISSHGRWASNHLQYTSSVGTQTILRVCKDSLSFRLYIIYSSSTYSRSDVFWISGLGMRSQFIFEVTVTYAFRVFYCKFTLSRSFSLNVSAFSTFEVLTYECLADYLVCSTSATSLLHMLWSIYELYSSWPK